MATIRCSTDRLLVETAYEIPCVGHTCVSCRLTADSCGRRALLVDHCRR